MNPLETDIVIVGGGPVGLYLAGRLLQKKISCLVLEKRSSIDLHSKSLGIHPVSLELFERAGISDSFLDKGVKIKKGIAYWNRDKIGEISFEKCRKPFNYILAIPQWKTEEILQKWVPGINKKALIRGADVNSIQQNEDGVFVSGLQDKKEIKIKAKFLVGCDGKNSFVRNSQDIPFEGSPYPDSYIMGDFEDNTGFGNDAAVFLHQDGLIESFPLPNGYRRWVVKTDQFVEIPKLNLLQELVTQRIHHSLYKPKNIMLSSFGVQQLLAKTFHKNRVLLAGDAAHVVSPIGGQGMNLGWIDAEKCADLLENALTIPEKYADFFAEYSKEQRRIAKHTAKRAELNMHLGRKESSTILYKLGLKIFLNTPLNRLMANVFTMRGLGKWWI